MRPLIGPRYVVGVFLCLVLVWTTGRAQTPPDVLVVGLVAAPSSLDPHVVTAANEFQITENIYEGLVRFREGTLEPEPALATSWDVSNDGLVYTFDLRPGVRFHDGAIFDAQSVKFTFDRMLDKTHPYHHTGPFPLAFNFRFVDSVDVIDDATVRFRLKESYSPFLSALAYPSAAIVSPDAVRRYDIGTGVHPSGTGPFRFVTWHRGREVVLAANEDYWAGAPTMSSVSFRVMDDPEQRLEMVRSGAIDVLVEVQPDNLDKMRAYSGVMTTGETGPHTWYLIFNMRDGVLSDKRVRQALNLAVDKKAIADGLLRGTVDVAAGPVSPAFTWAFDASVSPWPYDPERALALLREAGASDAKLHLLLPENGPGMLDPIGMGDAIVADLQAVGLRVEVEHLPWSEYLQRVNPGLRPGDDMAAMAWMTQDPDTLPYLTLRSEAMPAHGGFNSGYFSNDEVDSLLTEARRSHEQSERAPRYRALQKLVHEEAPWLFVAHWRQTAIVSHTIRGFTLEPSFLLRLGDVHKERQLRLSDSADRR